MSMLAIDTTHDLALVEEIPTYRALATEVLTDRRAQGIRGVKKEHSRFNVHIATADFIDKLVTDIPSKEVRGWLRWMAAKDAIVPANKAPRKLDRATINRAYSLISVIFEEAVERELIEVNPCASVKQPKRVSTGDTVEKWSYLTEEEQIALFACPEIDEATKLFIAFAIGTGLRKSELTNLELPDLHVGDDPHVFVRYSLPVDGVKMPPKNGKKRRVDLMHDMLDVARRWLAMLPSYAPSNPNNLVFPTKRGFYRQEGKPLGRSICIHDVYAAAGIQPRKGLHIHALRHTFASNLVSGAFGRKPIRMEVLQQLMGHSSITVTQRYAHLSHSMVTRELREAQAIPMLPLPPTAPDTERMIDVPVLPEDTIRDLNALDIEEDGHVAA